MTEPNDTVRRLAELAEANGWAVIAISTVKPCSVTLEDWGGVRVTIASDYGLGIEEYVRQLKAQKSRVVVR